MRPSPSISQHGRLSLLFVLTSCLVTAACFGDPPPDLDAAPLEVVVGSKQQPDEPCLLNRSELGAGTHEISVIVESGPAAVRIVDSAGAVVFQLDSSTTAIEAASLSTQLTEGTHTVECVPQDGPVTGVRLMVVPAS